MQSLQKIYDLRTDHSRVQRAQEASLDSDWKVGVKIVNGLLIGTEGWFKAIESALIPTQIIRGIISEVYMTGHNDFPQFKIQSHDGLSTWMRNGDDAAYKIGKEVILLYVNQKLKRGPITQIVTEIWIEE